MACYGSTDVCTLQSLPTSKSPQSLTRGSFPPDRFNDQHVDVVSYYQLGACASDLVNQAIATIAWDTIRHI